MKRGPPHWKNPGWLQVYIGLVSLVVAVSAVLGLWPSHISSSPATSLSSSPKIARSHTLIGHRDSVTSLAFSPDGQTLASGSYDETIKLWDMATYEAKRTLEGHIGLVSSVAYSRDGAVFSSGSWESGGCVRVWDVEIGREARRLGGAERMFDPSHVAVSPDGIVLVENSLESLQLWSVTDGRSLGRLVAHDGFITTIAYSPTGDTVASAGADKTIKLWSVSYTPLAQKMSLEASFDLERTLIGHDGPVRSVAFSPDGQTLASGSGDRTIKLWDVANGREMLTLRGHAQEVSAVAFSPRGNILASGGSDRTIMLWAVASGRKIQTLIGHLGTVNSLAFSPDGRTLASGSGDRTVGLWDVSSLINVVD